MHIIIFQNEKIQCSSHKLTRNENWQISIYLHYSNTKTGFGGHLTDLLLKRGVHFIQICLKRSHCFKIGNKKIQDSRHTNVRNVKNLNINTPWQGISGMFTDLRNIFPSLFVWNEHIVSIWRRLHHSCCLAGVFYFNNWL